MTQMRAEFINPFVSAMQSVFSTMFHTKLVRGQIYLRRPGETHGGISGVIGLSGRAAGAVAILVSNDTAIKITERFLGMDVGAVNDDVVDCMGEVVNMVAGNAKAQLDQFHLSISLPSIVRGADHIIEFPRDVTPICLPFQSDIGEMLVQVGFVVKDKA